MSVDDMDKLTIGLVLDIWNEKSLDNAEEEKASKNGVEYVATQADFDRF